jgi:tetratricopeptide (TPR) repeat protein
MAKMVIRSYQEINAQRKKARFVLFLMSLPFLVFIILYTVNTFVSYQIANQSLSSYEQKEFKESQASSEKLKTGNLFEKWKVYYNSGTAYLSDGEYNDAQNDLETALLTVPSGAQECAVRSNLVLTYEAQGDQAEFDADPATADAKYKAALQIISEAPPECAPPKPQSGPSEGQAEDGTPQTLEESKDRISEKLGQESDDSADPADGSESEEGETETPSRVETEQEKIERQLEQSNSDRNNKESNQRGENKENEEPVDKPW